MLGGAVQAAARPALATGPFTREEVATPGAGQQAPFGVSGVQLADSGNVLAAWTTPAPSQSDAYARRNSPLR